MSNEFNFFVGLDIDDEIFKASSEAKGEDRYKNMIVQGLASDASEDAEGEFMEPAGFEIDEFLKSGLLNLEHYTSRKGDPQFWIGEPIDGKVVKNEFFVKGKLWSHHPLARNFWDTLLIMKASGSTRKAGFSIEGKALARDPLNKKRVTKARIAHMACTLSPVNKNSFMDIVKGNQKEDFVEAEIEQANSKYVYEFEKGGKQYGITKTFEIEEKEEDDNEEKAVTTESSKPLRRESLDKRTKSLIQKAIRSRVISPKRAYFLLEKFYNQ